MGDVGCDSELAVELLEVGELPAEEVGFSVSLPVIDQEPPAKVAGLADVIGSAFNIADDVDAGPLRNVGIEEGEWRRSQQTTQGTHKGASPFFQQRLDFTHDPFRDPSRSSERGGDKGEKPCLLSGITRGGWAVPWQWSILGIHCCRAYELFRSAAF